MTIINAVAGAGDEAKLVSIDNAVTEFPQTFSPPTGYDGLSSVTVQAPANFKASNIKKDVEIAGVTGTYEGDSDSKFTKFIKNELYTVTSSDFVGVSSIRSNCFAYSNIQDVLISDSAITSIESYAFQYCSKLNTVELPSTVKNLDVGIFNYSGLKSIDLSGLTLVTTIPKSMFYTCLSLESIKLPPNITEIGTYVFYRDNKLTSIDIPDGVTEIGGNVFMNCTVLPSVKLPASLKTLGSYAFYNTVALKEITIPSNVTTIQDNCFVASGITTMILEPETPPTLGTTVFRLSRLSKIIVPKGTLETYKSATNWSEYADYMVEAEE